MGDLVRLRRTQVTVDPLETYREIGIRSFGKGIFHKEPVGGEALGAKRVFQVHPGDLVLSNVFAWEGAIARATDAEEGMIGSHRFMTYEAKSENIDLAWLHYFLMSESGLKKLRAASPGSAGRNRTLGVGAFEDIAVPLLGVAVQHDVVQSVARSVDHLRSIEELRDARQQMLDAWSRVLLMPSGLSSSAASNGWAIAPLSAGLELNDARTDVAPGVAYNIAGVYSFGRGLFARGPLDGSETTYKHLHRLRSGDLVLSRLKGWEGALAVVPETFDGWFLSPEFPTFTIDDAIFDRRFLKHLVTSELLWSRLKGESTGIGARKERVTAQRLLDLEVAVPSITEQRRLADHLDLIEEVGRRGQSVDEVVRALTPSILNQAFAGLL